MSFAERILGYPIEMISGVPETLEYLYGRHDLVLFTKGHPKSRGSDRPLRACHLLPPHPLSWKEKDPEALWPSVEGLGFDAKKHLMVGTAQIRHQSGLGHRPECRVHPRMCPPDPGTGTDSQCARAGYYTWRVSRV